MNWATVQQLQLLAAVVTGAGILVLACIAFASVLLRRGIQSSRNFYENSIQQLTTRLDAASGELEKLKARITEIDACRSVSDQSSTAQSAATANGRSQVLRLHRRGESPSDIASVLGLSHGEVKLIIKMYNLTREEKKA